MKQHHDMTYHEMSISYQDSLLHDLAAAEVYPTSVRSTAHGMSAAVGKCGALVPTVLFNYIGNTTKFWVVCWAGLLGFFMTVMFIPDATGESCDFMCNIACDLMSES